MWAGAAVRSGPVAACFRCGIDVDPLRSPARIVGARVVSVCRDCARAPSVPAVVPAAAPPVAAPVEPARAPRPIRRRGRRVSFAIALCAMGGAAALVVTVRSRQSSAVSPPAPPPPPPAPIVVQAALVSAPPEPETLPPPPAPPPRRPRVPGLPQGSCVFPLPSSDRAFPIPEDRQFGADRPGESHAPECGGGHCGVDLSGAEGTPVLAVREGVVEKVVRRSDEKGGRWVLVRHAGGMSTYYMHLDEIRSDLAPDVRVAAGEPLGTLGRSGIKNSAPHLHFAITMNDGSGETHVDPMPFLRGAVAVDPHPAPVDPASAAIAPAR